MLTENDIQQQYPLHCLVWKNSVEELKNYLSLHSKDVNLEQKDNRQRTPLMLATALDHKECIRILLDHNALVNVTDYSGFNVLHEAVTTADPKLIRDVYLRKELQRINSLLIDGIPQLLSKICDTTDFYLEMKWEFTSWFPLISKLCPSDTYRIYKRGSKVRVDSTLIGIDEVTNEAIIDWQRGNTSLILSGSENGCTFIEIDHNKRTVQKRTMEIIRPDEVDDLLGITDDQIVDRLTQPIKTMYIDTEKVNFERAKSGFIGFRTDRIEQFNGYECKVYLAQNVEFITKTRIEHLTQEDKKRYKKLKDSSSLTSIRSIVGIHEQNILNPFENDLEYNSNPELRRNPYRLSMVDYFNLQNNQDDQDQRDIGSPREMNIKKQYFKANIWMSDDFPLSLKEQILPIVDMVATYSSHFAKLRDFIHCKLPTGFPVKIEIPLFHLLNAVITFGNVFAQDQPVDGVHIINLNIDNNDGNQSVNRKCTVDEKCFEPPEDYEILATNDDGNGGVKNNKLLDLKKKTDHQEKDRKKSNKIEPELSIMEALNYDSEKDLQKAIQLSLMEYNQKKDHCPPETSSTAAAAAAVNQTYANGSIVKSKKKLTSKKLIDQSDNLPMIDADDDKPEDQCSLKSSTSSSSYQSCDNSNNNDVSATNNDHHHDGDGCNSNSNDENEEERLIRLTMEQSKRDHDEYERRRQLEEDEIFNQILKLSLVEK
uniref:Ankyrin repeat domain-containing protein 13A-like isoform X1 n=1 Tax=Dermatophagoides pteronyssinus TaxID=6956 RepID=A0A6P6YAX8_DERPT|nr:ankyrin repeat domain-containing protein 13A-like isoform X1 [Dermatophagoides pteronyssinus]